MILNFLPYKFLSQLNGLNLNDITEVRLKVGYPICVVVDGQRVIKGGQIICTEYDVKSIIASITENSLYAYNEQLKNGFLTTKEGVRIGVAGECVFHNDRIVTIKNISSLNIRVPHIIRRCADNYVQNIVDENENVFNSLIIAPPSYGKTTLLKDISLTLNERLSEQILIIDERGEFDNITGINIDKISYSDKLYAFSYGLRSMSPSIIITDELSSESDWNCVLDAVNSGVKIIASCHGNSIDDVKNKRFFKNHLFERYFTIDIELGIGKLGHCYDEDFNVL